MANQQLTHTLVEGVLINEKLLNKDKFHKILNQIANDKKRIKKMREIFMWGTKVQTIITKKNTIVEYIEGLNAASKLLQDNIFGDLGGKIGLITSFNGQRDNAGIYFFANELDLTNSLNLQGAAVYKNTLEEVEKLKAQGQNIVKAESALTKHFIGFQKSLVTDLSGPQNKNYRTSIKTFAQKYAKARYQYNGKNKDVQRRVNSLSQYFFGQHRYKIGYYQEAFITHMLTMHKSLDFTEKTNFVKDVIDEYYYRYGDWNLLQILASVKGNTSALLSGDNIIIDKDGNVKFNIQSKASYGIGRDFTIRYQKFLTDMRQMLELLQNVKGKVSDEDCDIIYNHFKTRAWMPARKVLQSKFEESFKDIESQFLTWQKNNGIIQL